MCARKLVITLEKKAYMPDYFEAYFLDELLGTFSSKVEAAAELLLHAERGAFAQ